MARLSTFCLTALLLIGPLDAQEFTGTLQRIAESGQMRIGYVPDAPPLSFRDAEGNVTGYSIDLCREIAAQVQTAVGLPNLEIVYVPLGAPEERLSAVENGTVDIECGATTVTLSRRERVDFTLMTFITGGSDYSYSMKATSMRMHPTGRCLSGRSSSRAIRPTTRSRAMSSRSSVSV